MTTAAIAPGAADYKTADTYAGQKGVWSWLTTVDHKRIGKLYLFTALFFFMVGGLEAILIRAQLGSPNRDLVSAELYN